MQNPTQAFLSRPPTPFLVTTVPCTRPYSHQPGRIPSPKWLPWSLVLYYVSTSTHCSPRPCIQQKMFNDFISFATYSTESNPPAFHDHVSTICSSIVVIEDAFLLYKFLAQPDMIFVFFFVELALLFLCLVVFDSPGFHCFLQTSLHFLPCWFPFSFFINHLITKSYRFPLSHTNFLHCLHRFHNNCILLLDHLSSSCSFNPLIDWLGHVLDDTQSCLPQRLQSSFAFLSLQVQSFIACLLSQHVLSLKLSLNCLI